MAYSKQTWVRGEKVASTKLNHMEDGIAAISANGAIGTANLANGAVTNEKLAQSGGVLSEVSDLKSTLSYSGLDISDNKIYAITHPGQAFPSSGTGYTHIDISTPVTNAAWDAYLIPCSGGDVFTIFAVGGLTTYAYAFIDSNGDIQSRSASNYTADSLKITAPANTAYLIVNDKGGASRVYSGDLLIKDINRIHTQIINLQKAFDDVVFYVTDSGNVSWSPYSVSPVEYNIGSKNYTICAKGVNTVVTPSDISTAAINAGLTVSNNVISGTSYAILFDPNEHEISVVKSPLTAGNVAKTTSSVIIFLAHYKSIRIGKAVDYMTEKRLESLETDTDENASSIAAISAVVGNDIVPSYFESNLSAKIPEIISNMNDAGQNGTSFVFITDIHWETNYKKSPALVKRVLDKTSVKNVFCGGDIINEGEKTEMYEVFIDCINHYRFVANSGFFPIARGNHDDNSNWSSSADVSAHEFDANTVYNLLYSQVAELTTRIGSNWAFYFDQQAVKTRYIFVDTKRNGLVIDHQAIIDCMSSVQTGWHIIFVMHFTLNNATTLFAGCDLLAHIVKAYNDRSSGSYAGTYQTATYDFTNAVGTVDLIIGGHMHADYAMNADDANNPAGIPIIATDTDSYRNHSGTEGTVNSQCFDIVTVDYDAKTVKCVRVGRGSDRTFSY